MVTILGHSDGEFAYSKPDNLKKFSISSIPLQEKSTPKEFDLTDFLTKSKALTATTITHVSFQYLALPNHNYKDEKSSKEKKEFEGVSKSLLLLAITCKERTKCSLIIAIVSISQSQKPGTFDKNKVLNKIVVVKNCEEEIAAHLLPKCCKNSFPSEEGDIDTQADTPSDHPNEFVITNKLLVLTLNEGIALYEIEVLGSLRPLTAKLNILSSEPVAKAFWWAQWLPQQEAVVFAHYRKPRQSFDDDEAIQAPKPLLSVLQFHKDFPRESVLNMPLDQSSTISAENRKVGLSKDPNILSPSSVQMKLIAHPSGATYLFRLSSDSDSSKVKYSVHLMHHNKTLEIEAFLPETAKKLVIDVGVYSKDQYLLVVGYPHFLHFLDAGSTHEPSHHLIFKWKELKKKNTANFFCIFNSRKETSIFDKSLKCDEKTDLSPKYLTNTNIVFDDLTSFPMELSSALLLPLLDVERRTDITFKLAVLHHFLVHKEDINVAKRIVYDEGRKLGNLLLKRIYQEFLIGHAHLQTKKQIAVNLDTFRYLVPYSADPETNSSIQTVVLNIHIQKTTRGSADVSIMLLSPSQRVFPHNVTDLWTSLWHLNRQYSKSKRFNHKDIAEKLLLSLQCYKPEALSRANTPGPMSPSSPMVCTSLGDIVGMFGRKATELQLPFIEHESCTANKQEYIFSINLREMSMHLLKERKEWPLHGHTVAGKYVCALGDTARLLCHLLCLTANIQPTRNSDKGFALIDSLEVPNRLNLFILMEHYSLALGQLACPLPQGFTPFFAYLGYRVLRFDQFLWHVRAGTFDLQIDLVKTIMTDMSDEIPENVPRKLQLLSLLPKTRANRIMNSWSHEVSISIRARQHASDLLSGSVSQNRKRMMLSVTEKKKRESLALSSAGTQQSQQQSDKPTNALDTFFQLLTAKANPSEIDLGLLTEATIISMDAGQED